MIKVITFDLDDTLWEIEPVLVRAEQRLYQWLLRHTPELCQRHSSQSLAAQRMELIKQRPELAHQISEARICSLEAALQGAGYNAPDARELALEAFNVFLDARHEVSLFDQVEEVIAQLHTNYLLGVLTNGNADIYRLPLGRYFSFSFSAEQLDSSKPAPAHFRRTLDKTGAKSFEIIHVGDHVDHDISGAQRQGWHTIWVNNEGLDWPTKTPPTETVTSVSAVPDAVQRIERLQQAP